MERLCHKQFEGSVRNGIVVYLLLLPVRNLFKIMRVDNKQLLRSTDRRLEQTLQLNRDNV